MNILSRKLVTFLAVIIWQSSLGTNADLVNAKNLGQNGYKKYEDGMLIQWGKSATDADRTVYFPQSFLDKNYSFATCFEELKLSNAIYSILLQQKYPSYFRAPVRYYDSSGFNASSQAYYWIAIGRWK